jgi:mannose-6-phosphate isomerase
LTAELGERLLGGATAVGGRFPLLLKLLDANDILSLQVHPDDAAVEAIGPEAALKTECWYVVESRGGSVYKGLMPGVTRYPFAEAVKADAVEGLVRRIECETGDFHFLPAGTVHALGAGLLIAEVQTPSDTTYRVTDWGRGREIHVERSMQCIHFEVASDDAPGADGETLLVTEFFNVAVRTLAVGGSARPPQGRCAALMMLGPGDAEIRHEGEVEPVVPVAAGETVLLPAELRGPELTARGPSCRWLEITLPESQ